MTTMALSAGSVLAEAAARQAGQILHPDVPEGDTATHRRRVACRRLRSDLRTCEPLLDPVWSRRLRADLTVLAGVLAPARDAEVLLERLTRHALPGSEPIAATLRARFSAAEALIAAHLASRRHAALRAELANGLRLLKVADFPALPVLAVLAARPWETLVHAARRLRPDDPDEVWHAVRIDAKRARYANELVAAAGSQGAARLTDPLAAVQDVLGQHQDAVIAAHTWRELSPNPVLTRRLIQRERDAERAARAAFPEIWRACRIG